MSDLNDGLNSNRQTTLVDLSCDHFLKPTKTKEYKKPYVLALMGCLVFSGCAQLSVYSEDSGPKGEGREQLTGVDIQSSYPAVRRGNFEKINILELVDPNNERKKFRDSNKPSTDIASEYDLAFAAFRLRPDTDAAPKTVHRNSVQDRMLSVSTSRCNVFKTYLRRQQSDANFVLGTLTTASGVLGAVLPGANASRNLAGTAGLFSGMQAEYNSAYFSNLAAHVIIQGIESRQKRMLDELMTRRANLTIEQYSMEAAVRDAIYFDGSCSTLVGLQEAGDAIKDVTNPGLQRAVELIAQAKVVKKVMEIDNIQESQKSGELAELLKQSQPKTAELVVSVANLAPSQWAIGEQIARSASIVREFEVVIQKMGQEVQTSYDAGYAKLPEDKRKAQPPLKQLGETWVEKLKDKQLVDWTGAFQLDQCIKNVMDDTLAWSQAKGAQFTVTSDNPADRIKKDSALAISEAKVLASVSFARNALGVATDQILKLTQTVIHSDEIKQAQTKDAVDAKFAAVLQNAKTNIVELAKKTGCQPPQ